MPAYLVEVDPSVSGRYLAGGGDSHVVFAADATGAREAVAARFGDDSNSFWNDTNAVNVTELVADADLEGWVFAIKLYNTTDRLPAEQVSVTGGAGDAPDDVAAALVTALNATGSIANASYNDTSNTLTVAGAGDGIGDWTFSITAVPPWGETTVDSLFGTLTDEGASGDALTVVMPGDSDTLPFHYATLRTR
jgi:hypothetical protein